MPITELRLLGQKMHLCTYKSNSWFNRNSIFCKIPSAWKHFYRQNATNKISLVTKTCLISRHKNLPKIVKIVYFSKFCLDIRPQFRVFSPHMLIQNFISEDFLEAFDPPQMGGVATSSIFDASVRHMICFIFWTTVPQTTE